MKAKFAMMISSHKSSLIAALVILKVTLSSGLSRAQNTVASDSVEAPGKRIYLANDDHTDFMWTADADTYARVFVEMLDFHLQLAEQTKDNPAPYQNRFNADGSYWLWSYEKKCTPAEFSRLMDRVREGVISAPLNTVVSCYGGQPLEAVLRGMYYSGRLERKYDLRFPLASAMENQTLPRGLASLFAGAGASYSWRGICGCATRMDKKEFGHRPHEIYWWTGPDGQKLLMKWYSYGPSRLGGYWEAGTPLEAIRVVTEDERFLNRYRHAATNTPYDVVGLFGFGGDDLARRTGVEPPPEIPGVPGLHKLISSPYADHFHEIAKQMSTPQRQVIVSNEIDFFKDFEQQYGALIESESVTYGNEWDLYSASMSETSSRVKRSIEKLRTAELLSTLVSLKYPTFMDRHTTARDRAFADIGLFWEHNWTADGPVSRAQRGAWQNMLASQIEYYVDSIYGEALIRLGGMIERPENSNRFFVLNSLGWSRTDYADFPFTGSSDIDVVEVSTGELVPYQLKISENGRFLRILAKDVPPAGYKVFEITKRKQAAQPVTPSIATFDGKSLSCAHWKVNVEPDGAISSLVSTSRPAQELAAQIDGLWINDLAPNTDEGSEIEIVNQGPVSMTLRASSQQGVPHCTQITVFEHSPRLEIENRIEANFSTVKHWGFSFAIPDPQVHTEEVGAINLNRLTKEGGHYADSHARYDYLTVNHFATMTSVAGDLGLTISNPDLPFAALGRSSVDSLDTATPQLRFLAGGQVDGSSLGIPRQLGETQFHQRFALIGHNRFSASESMKFALEHQNPLATGAVISKVGTTTYDPAAYSLLAVDHPDVMLWTVKPHEDGIKQGIIARVWNVSSEPVNTPFKLNVDLEHAWKATHIETDIEKLAIRQMREIDLRLAPQQISTYRLQTPGPTPTAR